MRKKFEMSILSHLVEEIFIPKRPKFMALNRIVEFLDAMCRNSGWQLRMQNELFKSISIRQTIIRCLK